ncbi:hypothetical protein [Candidatus Ichthyocystis hellenicum]|uniref:hypothetical protein n=1 Tax=Candidatus Ichthyocystis hellenicum TaxID=1561003 RepID=UPI000B8530C7|nr:hypothetical protein [Candidatus Ichthyocystis hellenicum]
MNCINGNNYSNCLECGDLEDQTERGVIEDSECKELIPLEQETNRVSSSSVARSLGNKVAVASVLLGFIGMLESAAGSRITPLASNHCNLSSLVCTMVANGYSELVNTTLEMAFKDFLTNPNNKMAMSKKLRTSYINDTIPVTVVIDERSSRRMIRSQLSFMAEYVGELLNILNSDSEHSIESNNTDLVSCNNNVGNFCYKNGSRNDSYYGGCCTNISSYIKDIIYDLSTTSVPTADLITYNATTSSVIDESTAIISTNTTTSPVSTTLSSVLTSLSPVDVTTTVTTTLNESNGSLSTFIFVAISFFVGVVLLFVACMGFRSGRRRGIYHVGGSGEESRPVYMRGSIEEHCEENEEESRPVYMGGDIEEHSI